jgi:ABC-type branched-subunit amino acid transport system ATPase component
MTSVPATLAEPPAASLVVEGLTVRYGHAIGVKDVSLSIDAGRVTMLVGPNGAGKTTVLRAIAGFLSRHDGRVVGGRILLDGKDIGHASPDRRARQGIRLIPERKKVFGLLSVEQNLELFHGRRLDGELRSRVWKHFPQLEKLRQNKAGTLSGGERQMLALTVAVLSPVRVLLIDEMSLGLAPAAVDRVAAVVRELHAERGFTVFMVEQNRSLDTLADRVLQLTERGITA